MRAKTPKTTPAKKPAKKLPEPTVHEIKKKIIATLEQVETIMRAKPRPEFRGSNPMHFASLYNCMRAYRDLWGALQKQWDEPEEVDAWIEAALTDPAGEVPRWSRRGKFVLWVEDVPVLICWEGLLRTEMIGFAIDAAQPFFSIDHARERAGRRGQPAVVRSCNGVLSLGAWHQIKPEMKSVVDVAIAAIDGCGKTLVLRPLAKDAKLGAAEQLAAEPWLEVTLQRGREHRMRMPQHLGAMPQTLFG